MKQSLRTIYDDLACRFVEWFGAESFIQGHVLKPGRWTMDDGRWTIDDGLIYFINY